MKGKFVRFFGLVLLFLLPFLAAMPALGAEEVQTGGTLMMRTPQDNDNYDPHTNDLMVFRQTIRLAIYDTLVRYDENLEMEPMLAESWENPDDTTYIFHLREGVSWHDGEPFNAADVVHSFERVMNPDTGSYLATRLAQVDSVEALDDHTVKVVMKEVNAAFLDNLVAISIVPEHVGDEIRSNPVGTGSFTFVEWEPNERIVLAKNENYWKEGLPYLDKIVFKIIPDTQVALTNLEAGEVDLVDWLTPADAEIAKTLEGVELYVVPDTTQLAFWEVSPTSAVEPLRDPKVRQALVMCIDREAIGDLVFKGYGQPAINPIPEKSWAYTEIKDYGYDPAKAKELLAELGYKEGDISFKIITWAGYKTLEDMSLVWQQGLAEAGVNCEVEVLEVQVMLGKYTSFDYDVTTNVYAPSPDPNSWFDVVMMPHLRSESVAIKADYDNPEMFDLIIAANSTLEQEKRKGMYARLQEWNNEELVCILAWREAIIAAHKPIVHGFIINGLADRNLSETWIEH
ncbi:MAG: ABC transporter substrate-binding protein [Candidatus Neomarinimicrobiota bacterium]